LTAASSDEFYVDSGDHTRIAFVRDSTGKVSGAILILGHGSKRPCVIDVNAVHSGMHFAGFDLRQTRDLLKQFKLISTTSQSCFAKTFSFAITQIRLITSPSRLFLEGRFAIVTDVGRGMRWTQAGTLTNGVGCGRRSRVVLAPRRWR